MGCEWFNRATAEHRGMQVGDPTDNRHPGNQPCLLSDLGQQRPEHGPGGHQGWQAMGIALGPAHEFVDVRRSSADVVVSEPGQDHGSRGRRRTPGETHAKVIDRLHQPACTGVLLGELSLQQERVPGRIRAGWCRRASGHADPGQHLLRCEALHGYRATDHFLHVGLCTSVGPQQDWADRMASLVHRDCRPPLTGDPDRLQLAGIELRRNFADGLTEGIPPFTGVLRGLAIDADVDRDRALRGWADRAVRVDGGHLGAPVAQVDGEDPGHLRPRALRRAWRRGRRPSPCAASDRRQAWTRSRTSHRSSPARPGA